MSDRASSKGKVTMCYLCVLPLQIKVATYLLPHYIAYAKWKPAYANGSLCMHNGPFYGYFYKISSFEENKPKNLPLVRPMLSVVQHSVHTPANCLPPKYFA